MICTCNICGLKFTSSDESYTIEQVKLHLIDVHNVSPDYLEARKSDEICL